MPEDKLSHRWQKIKALDFLEREQAEHLGLLVALYPDKEFLYST